MKGIVVYESKNGSTETYAQWLAEDLGFECRPVRKAGNLSAYEVIVLGSCVHAFKLSLGSWIRKMWPKIKDKKVALFSVAGASRSDPKRDEYLLSSVGPRIAAELPHFKLDGRMRYDRMRWIDRKMMQMYVKMTEKKDPGEAERAAEQFDRVDRNQLAELRTYLSGAGRNTVPDLTPL